MTTVSVSGNQATITFAPDSGKYKTYTIASHSSRQQIVSLKVDSESPKEHQITGEGHKTAAAPLPQGTKNVVLTFAFDKEGQKVASQLTSGGPYDIGKLQLVVVVAENGDDADYNDAVVQFMVR